MTWPILTRSNRSGVLKPLVAVKHCKLQLFRNTLPPWKNFSGKSINVSRIYFHPQHPTTPQFSWFRSKKIVPQGSWNMPKTGRHGTRRMPRMQTGQGTWQRFCWNERVFHQNWGTKTPFLISSYLRPNLVNQDPFPHMFQCNFTQEKWYLKTKNKEKKICNFLAICVSLHMARTS